MLGTLLEKLFVSIGADFADLRSDMGGVKGVFKDTFKDINVDLKKVGQGMSDIGKSLSLSVTAPILAMGAATLKVGSDAEEMQSMFKAVFKDLSSDVEDWAETHSGAVNRSRFDLMEYAASLQDTFVPMGFARDQAAELSKGLTELAIDVASFKNAAEADVVRDFQSALVGNTETVRKYGIVITQATLGSELMSMGIEGGVKAATEAEKTMARYNIILRGTTDAHGDAERTSGSFANQMKGLKAQLGETAVLIGTDLIPIFKEVVTWLGEQVKSFNSLDDEQRKQIIQIAAIVAAIGPLLVIGGKSIVLFYEVSKAIMAARTAMMAMVAAMNLSLGPIGLVIAGVGLLVAAYLKWGRAETDVEEAHRELYKLIEESEGIRSKALGTTEDEIRADIEAAKAKRELIKAMIEEQKLLVQQSLDKFTEAQKDGGFFDFDMGGIVEGAEYQMAVNGLRSLTEEYAAQDKHIKTLGSSLDNYLKKKEEEAAATQRLAKAEEDRAAKSNTDKELKALQEKSDTAVSKLKDEADANLELAEALKTSNHEYQVMSEILDLMDSGFKGSSEEARELAEELLRTRDAIQEIEDLKASEDLVDNINDQISANYELAEAAAVSTRELQIQQTVMELLREGYQGSAADARTLAEELISSQEALSKAQEKTREKEKKEADKLKKDKDSMDKTFSSSLSNLFDSVDPSSGIKGLADKLLSSLQTDVIDGALGEFEGLLGSAFKDIFSGLGGSFGGLFGDLFGGLGGVFGNLLNGILGKSSVKQRQEAVSGSVGLNSSGIYQRSPREIAVTVNGARGNQEINQMVRAGVRQGLGEYDRVAPNRVNDYIKRKN